MQRLTAKQMGDLLLNSTGDGITFSGACLVPDSILPASVNQHVAIIRADPTLCESVYLLSYLTHQIEIQMKDAEKRFRNRV